MPPVVDQYPECLFWQQRSGTGGRINKMTHDAVSWNDPIIKDALKIIADISGIAEDGLYHDYVIEAMFTDPIVKALKDAFAGQCTVSVGNPQPRHCLTVKEFLSGINKNISND
jgi:hypothetical protein